MSSDPVHLGTGRYANWYVGPVRPDGLTRHRLQLSAGGGEIRQIVFSFSMGEADALYRFLEEHRGWMLSELERKGETKSKCSPAVLARDAYRAYGIATKGKNYQGLPMPAWEDLSENIRDAWECAIDAVLAKEPQEPPASHKAIRAFFSEELAVLPSSDVLRVIHRVLDLMDGD